MAIVALIGIVLLVAAIAAPQWWVKHAIRKHGVHRPDIPGTGGELAKHLLERFGIDNVGVEMTDKGDHYDPNDRMVRLTKTNFEGASVSAVAVAAHEVGHAIQDHRGEAKLKLRNMLARVAVATDLFASVFFYAAPVLGIFLRTPAAFFGMIAIGIFLLGFRLLVHLVTLPVEYDASFGKALPILKEGGYIGENDLPAARTVLKAAAFTYVAGALMSLINLAQWLRILR